MTNRTIRNLEKRVEKELRIKEFHAPFIAMQSCENGKWYDFGTMGKKTPPAEIDISKEEDFPYGLQCLWCAGYPGNEELQRQREKEH